MPIIEVKNIGKKYNITHRQGGYVTLRDVLTNAFSNPFKFLKQKAKASAGLVKNEEFWALKDVSFNVEKGEVIGIIGRNGAGKSTLLKILSQITPPTTGEIRINGRVGSLLEVGTGFHPELSGRENIFLNGAILGMKKSEIAKKFDEIVKFAGIEKFLDTPVKYYSSGMYVRLAFSVAAHMEPDVLIIDEVLAVGDADFQKKCLGKMDEITKKEGRTILFVSHNMSAIQSLCKRCLLLKGGAIEYSGETKDVVNKYLNNESGDILDNYKKIETESINIDFIEINGGSKGVISISGLNDVINISIGIKVKKECRLSLSATLQDEDSRTLAFFSPGHTDNVIFSVSPGFYDLKSLLSLPKLMNGVYFISLAISDPGLKTYVDLPMAIKIISEGNTNKSGIVFKPSAIIGYEILDGELFINKK